jgi:hypothetical protein
MYLNRSDTAILCVSAHKLLGFLIYLKFVKMTSFIVDKNYNFLYHAKSYLLLK